MSGFYFNPWDPEFRANPYPHYKALVAGPPRLIDLAGGPVAIVARYADVDSALRDHKHFSNVRPANLLIAQRGPFAGALTMLTSDPPVHTRLRRLVSRDFTPRRIAALEPRIRAITDELLDQAERKGVLEVMGDIANVLPVMVIAELLGVPSENYQQFKQWSDAIVATGLGNTPSGAADLPEEFITAVSGLRTYFADTIEQRRRVPGSDLISALVAAHDDAEALDADELLALILLLLLAGNETTTNLIGNGLLALVNHPEQLELLRREPDLLHNAVEEILRYDGPVQGTVRFTLETAELAGVTIPAGAGVFLMLAAANRDPARFAEPDRFDIRRQITEHLAFGNGIHFCLGAPLARLEGSIAIGAIVKRFRRLVRINPEAPLRYKGSMFLRGLAELPLSIG
jgi:cytochrome P450